MPEPTQEKSKKYKMIMLKRVENYGTNFSRQKKLMLLSGLSVTLAQKVDSKFFADNTAYYKSIEQYKLLNNIEAYKKLKNYRGIRHILRLPVRGQRTHTNSHTARRIVYK